MFAIAAYFKPIASVSVIQANLETVRDKKGVSECNGVVKENVIVEETTVGYLQISNRNGIASIAEIPLNDFGFMKTKKLDKFSIVIF